jgi:hypothetical protein
MTCSGASDSAANVTQDGGPADATAHEVDATLDTVSFGYAFVGIVTE